MAETKITVFVVEDSPTARQLLVHIFTSDPRLEVIGTASGGSEALEWLNRGRPDVITMDVNMPGMDGFETTRRIMETYPVPIVIVSAVWKPEELATTFRAVEAGAVAVVAMPGGPNHPDHVQEAQRLVGTVKAMSEVKVIRRRPRKPAMQQETPVAPESAVRSDIDIVAIGASTGGPPVLHTILAGLPESFPVPLLIVQHISPGFIQGLVQSLKDLTGFQVQLAESQEMPMPGKAYFAPDGCHLEIRDGRLFLSSDPPDGGLRPSIARLFASTAAAYGSRAAGVLLTGMGRDGAEQLKIMRQQGALTIAQDQESCLVFGMPGEAVKLDAAEYVLPPERIAALLATVVKKQQR